MKHPPSTVIGGAIQIPDVIVIEDELVVVDRGFEQQAVPAVVVSDDISQHRGWQTLYMYMLN